MADIKEILEKEFGDNIIVSGQHLIDKPRKIVSISPALDIGLGKGLSSGLTIISGIEKSGKTLLSLYIASQCQQQLGSKVYYFNIENRINPKTIQGIPNLNLNDFHVIESTQQKIFTAEEYLDIAIKLITLEKNAVIIIDSFSNLCPSDEFSSKMSENIQMALIPKLLARFCRRVCSILAVNENFVIGVNHLHSNPGYGNPVQESGGRSLKYQADNKLICKKFELWKYPQNSENIIGLIPSWDIIHSSLGLPGKKITSYIRFGEGIDSTYELLNIAADLGIIIQKGAGWLTLDIDGVEKKVQGMENCRTFLKENPDIEKSIYDKIKSMMGI